MLLNLSLPYNSRFVSELLSHYPNIFKTKLSLLFLTTSHVPISHHPHVLCLFWLYDKHKSLAFQKCPHAPVPSEWAGSSTCVSAQLADFLRTQCPDQKSMPWQAAWRAQQPKRRKASTEESCPSSQHRNSVGGAQVPETVPTGLLAWHPTCTRPRQSELSETGSRLATQAGQGQYCPC